MLLFIFIYKGDGNNSMTEPLNIAHVPKIIHHIAPYDTRRWDPKWIHNYDTWEKYYPVPEYKHILWNENTINQLIVMKNASLYSLFQSYKTDTYRALFAKYIILYYYGGICADMDIPCKANKFNTIDLTTINFKYDANYLNNLSINVIASPQYNDFWKLVMYFANKINGNGDKHNSVGRELINMCYMSYSDKQKIKFSIF